MTIILLRGGKSRGIERHYSHDPGHWLMVWGQIYKRTNETSRGRIVYEWVDDD